jgi:coenzyme F420-reducing hydrogenase delta subunit
MEVTRVTEDGPQVVVFGCKHTATPVLSGGEGLPSFEYREIPCLGALDPLDALRVLDVGADGVLAIGCYAGRCRHLTGSQRAKRVVAHVGDVLEEAGLGRDRVAISLGSPLDPDAIIEDLRNFIHTLGGSDR